MFIVRNPIQRIHVTTGVYKPVIKKQYSYKKRRNFLRLYRILYSFIKHSNIAGKRIEDLLAAVAYTMVSLLNRTLHAQSRTLTDITFLLLTSERSTTCKLEMFCGVATYKRIIKHANI